MDRNFRLPGGRGVALFVWHGPGRDLGFE